MPSRAAISIVTPTFNSDKFLDATMASVIGQEPGEHGFVLHYHIQDGGSSDGTLEIVRRWQERIAAEPENPVKQVFLTVASEPDRGMYDAINRGFAATPYLDCQLMTWINADDLLASNAVNTVLSVLRDVPEVDWIGTRLTLIDEQGAVTEGQGPGIYKRGELRGGLYTGRQERPFVRQDGTFWRPKLWRAVNGLDASFRLAGDWDLWRRFAEYASLTVVDPDLGFRWRGDHQLSRDCSKYYAEVDARISAYGIVPESGLSERIQRVEFDGVRWVATGWPELGIVAGRIAPRAKLTRRHKKHSNKWRRELSRINHQRLSWQRRHFGRLRAAVTQ